jgi:hypothetical protein
MKLKHAILLYLLISVIDLVFFKNLIQSNDAFPYLFISEKYALGQFNEAVSGYWSPLLSWLCAPFVLLFKNPVIVIKIYNKLFGLIGIYAFHYFLKASDGIYPALEKISLVFFIILLNLYSHTETPDFIGANILLGAVYLSWCKHTNGSYRFLWVALLLSISYFAKLYNFFFAQLVLITVIGVQLFISREQYMSIVKFYFKQLLVYLICCFCWILVLHHKFGEWRYEYSSAFNKSIFGPDNCKIGDIEKNMINPMVKKGIIIPEKNQIFVGADEPRIYYTIVKWNMFSMENINRTFKIIFKNFKSIYYDFILRYMLFPLLFLLIFWRQYNAEIQSITGSLLMSSFFYIIGYVFIFYAPRYAYFTHLCVFISFSLVVCSSFKIKSFVFLFAFIFFIVFFSRNMFIGYKNDLDRMFVHQKIFSKINVLKQMNINGRSCLVADLSANKAKALDEEQFGFIMVNYFLRNQVCGVVDSKALDLNMVNRLKNDSINYVFAYEANIKQKLIKLDYYSKYKINNNGLELFAR